MSESNTGVIRLITNALSQALSKVFGSSANPTTILPRPEIKSDMTGTYIGTSLIRGMNVIDLGRERMQLSKNPQLIVAFQGHHSDENLQTAKEKIVEIIKKQGGKIAWLDFAGNNALEAANEAAGMGPIAMVSVFLCPDNLCPDNKGTGVNNRIRNAVNEEFLKLNNGISPIRNKGCEL